MINTMLEHWRKLVSYKLHKMSIYSLKIILDFISKFNNKKKPFIQIYKKKQESFRCEIITRKTWKSGNFNNSYESSPLKKKKKIGQFVMEKKEEAE